MPVIIHVLTLHSPNCSKDYVEVYKGRSLDSDSKIYQAENGQTPDPDSREYDQSGRSRFCNSTQIKSLSIVVQDTVATVYYHTDGNNSGSTPRGLRVDFYTKGI